MVDVMGHFAMAALWALPAWYRWHGRVALAFVGFALATAMLPDVDLLLRHYHPAIQHHGVMHTVLFVTAIAIVAGTLAAHTLAPLLERWWVKSEGYTIPRRDVHAFVTGGLAIGGLSHVFADMLSSPDIAAPVSPFWPVYAEPVAFDVIYYDSPVWNVGLLTAMLAVHLVAGYVDVGPIADLVRQRRG